MSIFSNSSMSFIDQTMMELQNQQNKHSTILQGVIQQYSKKLQNLQFHQNHLSSKLIDVQNNHQNRYLKYMKEQEKLILVIQEKNKYVNLSDLRIALCKQGQWTKAVGYFLNPQAAFMSYLSKLQMEFPQLCSAIKNYNNSQHINKQSLLKHSEKKLITIQNMIDFEEEIKRLDERYQMTVEDIQGRGEQIYSLIFEYEDLEEISQQMDQKLVNSQQTTILTKKSLLECQKKHQLLNNQKQIKEKQLLQLLHQMDGIKDKIRQLKQEAETYAHESSLPTKYQECLIVQQMFLPTFIFNMVNNDMQILHLNCQKNGRLNNNGQMYFEETQNLVIKIIRYIYDTTTLKKHNELYSNIDSLTVYLNKNESYLKQFQTLFKFLNQFKDPQLYMGIMKHQLQQNVFLHLIDQYQSFKKNFNILKQIFLQTNELDQLKYKINKKLESKIQQQIEKDVQKQIYDGTMTQQAYQKYTLQLKDLPAEYEQISILVERMSVIEQRRLENQFIIDQHKLSMDQITKNKQLIQINLKEFIQELFYLIEIENSQLLKMQQHLNSLVQETIPQFQSPQLVINNQKSDDHDIQYYDKQVEENRMLWNSFEQEQLKIMQDLEEQMNNIEFESNQSREKIMKTQSVLKEQKKTNSSQLNELPDSSFITNISGYNQNNELLQLTTQAIENKENQQSYNQLHFRSQSVMFSSDQDNSILGTASMDISSNMIQLGGKINKFSKKKITTTSRNINDNTNNNITLIVDGKNKNYKSKIVESTQFQPNWNNSTKNKVKNQIFKAKSQIPSHDRQVNVTPVKMILKKSNIPILQKPKLDNNSQNISYCVAHNRSQSSLSYKLPLSPSQKGIKKTKLQLVPSKSQIINSQLNISEQISRISPKNQISSPLQSFNSSKIFGLYDSYRSGSKKDNQMESIDNVSHIDANQSYLKAVNIDISSSQIIKQTKAVDRSEQIISNLDSSYNLMNFEQVNQFQGKDKDKNMFFSFKSPKSEIYTETKEQLIKVYKKMVNSKSARRPSLSGPPESSNYFIRYIRINQQNMSVDIYKPKSQDGDSQQLDLQLNKHEIKNVQKLGSSKSTPTYYILNVTLIDKSMKCELLFRQLKDMEQIAEFLLF